MKDKYDFNYIKEFIQKNNLNPATHRELPLFTLSCIAIGYSKMRDYLGFSYEAIAAIGGVGKFHTMFNEYHIIDETKKLIDNNSENLDKIAYKPAMKIAKNVEKKIDDIKELIKNSPEKCLKVITEIYSEYMISIAIYNCFWRYIGNEKNKGKLSIKDIEEIGKERDYIAKLYPQVEKIINECVKSIGEKYNFEGDLLRYFTLDEMKGYLKNIKMKDIQLKELKNRRNGYFYMYTEKPFSEIILTDTDIIKKIKDDFFSFKENIGTIHGYSIYGGKVIGIVYNLKNHTKTEIDKINKNFIIVATMTKPEDINIIKKSKAIITDEGGILSHASINARELKIPCIIGTKIATQVLNDGDLVEVDADKGVVRVIERAGEKRTSKTN